MTAVSGEQTRTGEWSLGLLLRARAQSKAEFHTVPDGTVGGSLTATELLSSARSVAAALVRDRGLRSGVPVVLALRDPLAFAVAFFGASLAGAVPVPGPDRADTHPAHQRRLTAILRSAGAALVVAPDQPGEAVHRAAAATGVPVATLSQLLDGDRTGDFPAHHGCDDEPAYVQYTSGSVGDPKPVVIRNRQVRAQLAQAAAVFGEDPQCVSVNWVPLHHDMGLVTSLLRPLWSGYRSVMLDGTDFIRRPRIWVEAMSEWRATHTSSPDFGYALCASRVEHVGGLDLSSLRVARSAGEMVRASTIQRFCSRFAAAGFRAGSFKPSYGLAEATLTVTTCPLDRPFRTVAVSRSALRRDAIEAPADDADRVPLVSSGHPLPETLVRIVSESGHPLPGERCAGRVWIGGPQVVERDPLPDGSSVRGYLTGDLGFLDGGELVLLGRSHDRFQVRGENFYSNEIEACIAAGEPRARAGRVAVFAEVPESAGETRTVVLVEVRHVPETDATGERLDLQHSVRRLVRREFGLSVASVLVLPPRSLPVTTSGKLQREKCRQRYLAGAFDDSDEG